MAAKKTKEETVAPVDVSLPGDITLTMLKEFWDMANTEYAAIRKRFRLLDSADRSKLWEAITAKFPSYQVLPETNHINYIKENLVASLYTVGKYAELTPLLQSQVGTSELLNKILGNIWSLAEVAKYQRKAGERAALLNVGYTQVGWNKDILGGAESGFYRGEVELKNLDPQKCMKDPYADSLDHGRFFITWDEYHINALKAQSIYAARLRELQTTLGDKFLAEPETLTNEGVKERATSNLGANKYVRLQTYWVKYVEDDKPKLAEIHVLNNEHILYVKKSLEPALFPVAELFCNEPGNDLIGISEPMKVFKNYVAYNLLNSIIATHAYKAQRPPRFINQASGINIRQFAQFGADADKTFVVNGDASQAVHYGKFPDLSPVTATLGERLEFDIKDKSGIDGAYTGRNTGSIQTTGGMDSMMLQVTGRDEAKVALYEEYTRRLTELIILNYIRYGQERKYAVKDKTGNKYTDVPVSFKEIANDSRFGTMISIQSELPRNKARLANIANILMEKQAQYKMNPEIITQEEWLLMQDIPFKPLIMERINLQRKANVSTEITSALFQFAGLIEQGIDPNEALDMVIDTAAAAKDPEQQLGLGNTATANNFQDAQAAPVNSFTPQEGQFTQ